MATKLLQLLGENNPVCVLEAHKPSVHGWGDGLAAESPECRGLPGGPVCAEQQGACQSQSPLLSFLATRLMTCNTICRHTGGTPHRHHHSTNAQGRALLNSILELEASAWLPATNGPVLENDAN